MNLSYTDQEPKRYNITQEFLFDEIITESSIVPRTNGQRPYIIDIWVTKVKQILYRTVHLWAMAHHSAQDMLVSTFHIIKINHIYVSNIVPTDIRPYREPSPYVLVLIGCI